MNLFDYLMCLIMGFRRRFNTIIFDLILMNGKTNDSLIVMAIVFIIIFLKSWLRTPRNWCRHDLNVTYVYCTFNLYVDGKHLRLAVNVPVTQRTREILLRHSYKSNRMVLLRFLERSFQILQGNCGYCCSCPTATMLALGRAVFPKSYDALACLARFSSKSACKDERTTSCDLSFKLHINYLLFQSTIWH